MASTYEKIANTTANGSSSTIDITSIPATYTDLVLIINGYITGSSGTDYKIRVNSDSGSNYSRTFFQGDGSSAVSYRESNVTSTYGYLQYTNPAVSILNFMNYSNTTTYKSIVHRDNAASSVVVVTSSLWRSTSAITSISLIANANFASGTTFTLYGILKA